MNIIKSYIVTNAAASSSGGGSGLTTFTSGNLSPLFTTSLGADPLVNPALTFTAVNQNANLVYAGPATGIAAAPTFRALAVADLPLSGAHDWAFENPGNANFFSVGGADPFDSVSFIANTLVQSYTGTYGIKVEPTGITLDIPSSATGDIFTRNASGFLTRIPDVATGNALISGGLGVVPSYGKIGLTTHVSGILPVANGGTGASSLSGLPFWSLTGDSTLNPSVGTDISVFIDSTDDLRFLPTTGDQVAGMAFGLPGNTFAQFEISSQIIRIHTRSSGFESINLSETQSNFYASDGTTNSSLRLTGTTATITGTLAAFAGLQAAADYSANFTARSYIDKGYADATYLSGAGVLGPANGGTGIANDAASTLTISGNFATTLTVSGVTGVTLPTSGTLATTAQTWLLASGGALTGTNTISGAQTVAFTNTEVTFLSAVLKVRNPANTFSYAFVGSAIGANRSLVLPNIGGAGNLLAGESAQIVGNRLPVMADGTGVIISSANLTFVTNRILGTTLYLTVSAGTTTAGTAPLKMTSGTNLTTAEAGAFEYNGADLFFTKSGTTRGTVLVGTAQTTEVVVSDATITTTMNGSTVKLLIKL